MENEDFKYLKKHYGENFAKLCRDLFPTLLETPGLLKKIITEKFDNVPTLYEDILPVKNDFKNYVYSFVDVENNNKEIVKKSPEELLDEAGYILYPECKTEKDIQKFKKYYKNGEELCTFRGGRLDYCRVWFAVKKNVDGIKRENFKNPTRQDEYGTSVISIQFTKGEHSTLSIKNRYNHTVNNPDSTFGNNLDNIIPGLTDSFCDKFNIKLLQSFYGNNEYKSLLEMLEQYVLGNDGKLYKSNLEIDGINYCSNNNIVYHNKVAHYDTAKYLLMDNYLLDLKNKNIIASNHANKVDTFTETIGKIKNISITFDEKNNKVITIIPKIGENIKIFVNKFNQIISYSNSNITEIGDYFLDSNKALERIDIPNVQKIGYDFLRLNEKLKSINLPNVKTIDDDFLRRNNKLTKIFLPNVKKIGDKFMKSNEIAKECVMPNVEIIGDDFFEFNKNIESIDLPNVKKIGDDFFGFSKKIKSVNLPSVIEIGDGFLDSNEKIESIELPNVKRIGSFFLSNNSCMKATYMPNIEQVGNFFLKCNKELRALYAPNLKKLGDNFLLVHKQRNRIIENFCKKNQEF